MIDDGSGAESFTPVGGVVPSAFRRENGLKEHSQDFTGMINSGIIDQNDLAAGKYDDAEVLQFEVFWPMPWLGIFNRRVLWIEQCTYDGEKWSAELSGISRWLKHDIGDILGRVCNHDLGDNICRVNLASFTVSSVRVAGVMDGSKRLIILGNTTDLSGSFADDYFKLGKVTFTSGANDGESREIKSYRMADRLITLQLPFEYDIAIDDTFSIVRGCNKLSSTCRTVFTNILNFGGARTIPGTDQILKSPTK